MLKIIDLQNVRMNLLSEMQRIAGCVARLRAWRSRVATARSLSALSESQLKDIGLHRSEVGAILRDVERRPRHRRP